MSDNKEKRVRPVMLCIMDGFGLAPAGPGNAIAAAKTPNLDKLFAEMPHTQLQASGRAVGLPAPRASRLHGRRSALRSERDAPA